MSFDFELICSPFGLFFYDLKLTISFFHILDVLQQLFWQSGCLFL